MRVHVITNRKSAGEFLLIFFRAFPCLLVVSRSPGQGAIYLSLNSVSTMQECTIGAFLDLTTGRVYARSSGGSGL